VFSRAVCHGLAKRPIGDMVRFSKAAAQFTEWVCRVVRDVECEVEAGW
jgi:hypothetical protein